MSASAVGNAVTPVLSNAITSSWVSPATDGGNSPEMAVASMTHICNEEDSPIASGMLPSSLSLPLMTILIALEKLPNDDGRVPARLLLLTSNSNKCCPSRVQPTPAHWSSHGSPAPQFVKSNHPSPVVESYNSKSWSTSSDTIAAALVPTKTRRKHQEPVIMGVADFNYYLNAAASSP